MEFSKAASKTLPPINCRTKDGLKLQLEVSFQYRVIKDHIYQLYTTYGNEMKNILLRVAIDSISDTATNYSSQDFFTVRDEIALKMHEDLEYRLSSDLFTKVVFFQLRSIDLPNDYEDAIQFTEVTKQSILLAEAQRKKNQVVLDTQIQQAAIAKQITTNHTQGSAEALILKAQAQGTTFQNVTQGQAQAYQQLKSSLGLSNPELIQYLQLSMIQNTNGNIVISLKNTPPVVVPPV